MLDGIAHSLNLVGLSSFIHFMFFFSVFFPVEPGNDIRFLEKSIIKIYYYFLFIYFKKSIFPYSILMKLKVSLSN